MTDAASDSSSDLVARARALRPLIEAEAEEAEATGTTTKQVVDAIAEQQLFWTMVPTEVRRARGADRDLRSACSRSSPTPTARPGGR